VLSLEAGGWHLSLTSYTWRTCKAGGIVTMSFGKPVEMRGRKASGPEVLTPRIAGLPARSALQSHRSVNRALLIEASRVEFRVAESALRVGSRTYPRSEIVRCQHARG
jgi:hypothetical protein